MDGSFINLHERTDNMKQESSLDSFASKKKRKSFLDWFAPKKTDLMKQKSFLDWFTPKNMYEQSMRSFNKLTLLDWFNPKNPTIREYIRSFNKFAMALTAFALAFSIILSPVNAMVVHAANGNVAGGVSGSGDNNKPDSSSKDNRDIRDAYTFDELANGSTVVPNDFADLKTSSYSIVQAMGENFKSASEYARWLKLALKHVVYQNEGSGYKFSPQPKLDGEATKTVEEMTDSELSKAYTGYNSVANKFNKIMARGAINAVTKDVFKTDEFDPTNAFVYGAIQYFTNAMNTLFNISSRVLMIGFLGQTGADCLFLVIPATGVFLAAANAQSHGAGAGGIGGGAKGSESGLSKIIKFNVVSEEAIEAANGSAASTGRVGAAGGNGQGGGFMNNKAVKYLVLRSPLIIIACTYLVLVATNLWEKLIAYISTITTQALYSFL